MPLVFVLYGSLRRGEEGHRQLDLGRRLRYLMPCTVRGRLFDLGAYPAFVAGEGIIHGDLCEAADPAILADLDAFEEYDPDRPANSLYLRERVALIEPRREAFIYRYNGPFDGFPEIASGDWVAYRAARDARP
ncbi:MAG: gamma-glutamylcyclotransferase [Bauldia sp.]|nr:gamma-glutamylcyclotransferase [Bauldia sp.]